MEAIDIYIKLDENLDLAITVYDPIYRGDHLSKKIAFLTPPRIGEIDMEEAEVYLSYIRADGTADIALLKRLDEKYNEYWFQYVLPVTSTLSRYPGEVCIWMQIFAGQVNSPKIQKSGECILQILESKNMDEYISDRHLSMVYQMQRQMKDALRRTEKRLNTAIEDASNELNERITEADENLRGELARKADNVVLNEFDGTLQLMSGEEPVGDAIMIQVKNADVTVVSAAINDNGELVIGFDDGSERNLGVVTGKDGAVYVPHIDERKILTFTIEDQPDGIPDAVDLNPNDEWSDISDKEIRTQTDSAWEEL